MPYRVTQGGMLNGRMLNGGDVIDDDEVAVLVNKRVLVDLGYLVYTEDPPSSPPAAKAAPEQAPPKSSVSKRR